MDTKENQYPVWWADKERTIVQPDRALIRETWEAMESLVDLGIARSIGSNFQAQGIYDILTYNSLPISALQVEHHRIWFKQNYFNYAKNRVLPLLLTRSMDHNLSLNFLDHSLSWQMILLHYFRIKLSCRFPQPMKSPLLKSCWDGPLKEAL